jgi:hypothetical protein
MTNEIEPVISNPSTMLTINSVRNLSELNHDQAIGEGVTRGVFDVKAGQNFKEPRHAFAVS